jgi:hypothetical protein
MGVICKKMAAFAGDKIKVTSIALIPDILHDVRG